MAGFLFELRQLRCFVAAADELHFGRAARRLNMTQPPLSRQIQLLEHALGVRLFERSSRNVALTSAGRVFLLEARRILRLSESAALATRRVASGEAGTVTIGFTAASGYSYLPRLITLCRERLPNITIHLKEMVSADFDEDRSDRSSVVRPHRCGSLAPADRPSRICDHAHPRRAARGSASLGRSPYC